MTVVKISDKNRSTPAKRQEDWSLAAPVLSMFSLLVLCLLLMGIDTGVSLVQQDKTPNLQYAEEVAND